MDAGCDQEMVQRCAALAGEERTAEVLRILSRHRRTLLDTVHQREKQIDCLDYLVYKLKKEQSMEE
nr:hypothetical protein [Butyricicoccus faecihominis]